MKMPWIKFFAGDWLKDPALSLCAPATRGIWMDLLCGMHELNSGGKLIGTRDQLARLARCTTEEMTKTLRDLSITKTANVSERNGIVTVVNRRMRRQDKLREQSNLRKMRFRQKRTRNAEGTHMERRGNAVDVRSQSTEYRKRAYSTGMPEGSGPDEARAVKHPEIEPEKSSEQTDQTDPTNAAQDASIPTMEEVVAYGAGLPGIPADFARHYHDVKTERQSWVTPQGKLVLWRNEIIRWWSQDRATWSRNHGTNTNRPNGKPNPRNAGVMGPPDVAQRIAAVAYRRNEESRKYSEARWAKVQQPVAAKEPGVALLPSDHPADG